MRVCYLACIDMRDALRLMNERELRVVSLVNRCTAVDRIFYIYISNKYYSTSTYSLSTEDDKHITIKKQKIGNGID